VSSISKLFPPDLSTSETEEEVEASDLLPAERAVVANAVPKRVKEFAAGRRCAREAIGRLGVSVTDLPANGDRTPRWPSGVIGCITHTDGYCAAVVGRSADYAGIGLDVERVEAMPLEVMPQICTQEEQALLHATSPHASRALAAMIFTAKECFYKCQYGITRSWLDFKDVHIQFEAGTFLVASRHPVVQDLQKKWSLRGQFLECDGRVVSGMVLKR
jgi:4'-phosphopantetheinyl transferase EntD